MRIRTLRYAVPGWGAGELGLVGGRVAYHALPRPGPAGPPGPPSELVARLQAYFAGARDDFHDVPLLTDLSPFQRAVLAAARRVPYGRVVTYGELAALAGYPRAQRAVGTFCARNAFGLFVPCHRVVAADGIGSYGELGSGYKRRLLELEGVAL